MSVSDHQKPGLLSVSVVICCHNSAKLLPQTLAHLQLQEFDAPVRWEVVVVDNASTDDTAEVARRAWGENAPAPMRIVAEPKIGLSNARVRGLAEAAYDIVSFIDDDNWVCPRWVAAASEVMTRNPEIGAIGSVNEAVADVAFPAWFDQFKSWYSAAGEQSIGWIGVPARRLYGAGMTVRKAAWDRLSGSGFRFALTGRSGKLLSGGEDIELALALYQSGWRLELEPRLRLKHHISTHRLKWSYLRRLARGYGASLVPLDPYDRNGPGRHSLMAVRRSWVWHVGGAIRQLLKQPTLIRALFSAREGDQTVVDAEWELGRIIGFVTLRGRYREIESRVWNSKWRVRV
jgi:glycosyltransferase involved in cell wall biosynthesis